MPQATSNASFNIIPSHTCHLSPLHTDHYVNGASDTGNPVQLFSPSESNDNGSPKAMGSPNECTNHDKLGLGIENGTTSSALEQKTTLNERVNIAQCQTESHQPARRSSLSTQTQTIPPPFLSASTQTQINSTSDVTMQTDQETQPLSQTYYFSNVEKSNLNNHNSNEFCNNSNIITSKSNKDKRDIINMDAIKKANTKSLSLSSPTSSSSSLVSSLSSLSTTTSSLSKPSSSLSSSSSSSSGNRNNLSLILHADGGHNITNNCIHTNDNHDHDPNLSPITEELQSSELKHSSSLDSSSTDKSSGNQDKECKRNLPLKSILKNDWRSRGLISQDGEAILPVEERDHKVNIKDLESKMASGEFEIGNESRKHDLVVYMPMNGFRKKSKKHMVQLVAMSACGFILVLFIVAWVLSPTFM